MRDVESERKKDSGGPRASAASAGHSPGKATASQVARDDVDLTHLNTHQGFDANRLGHDGGKNYRMSHASPWYQNDGSASGEPIPTGVQVEINAGAITTVLINGKRTVCAYVFMYLPLAVEKAFPKEMQHYKEEVREKPHEKHKVPEEYWHRVGAWVPASALPGAVENEQAALSKRISTERGDASGKFGKAVPIIKGASPQRDGVEALYTYPKQKSVQNKAQYYYYNLALNVPYTGGQRVGVLDDNVPAPPEDGHAMDPYDEFFPEEPLREETIPLWREGAAKAHTSGKFLHFVYGYVKNNAGSQIHGWINKSCLKPGFAHGGGGDGTGANANKRSK